MSANNELSLMLKEEAHESLLCMGICILPEDLQIRRNNARMVSFFFEGTYYLTAEMYFGLKHDNPRAVTVDDKQLYVTTGLGKAKRRCVFWR